MLAEHGQCAAFVDVLMCATSIESDLREFSEKDFFLSVDKLRGEKGFAGECTELDTLHNAKISRRFFIPLALFGYTLARNASIVSQCYGVSDIFATDTWGILKLRISSEDNALRIARATRLGHPVIAFYGGSTMHGVGCRLPEFSIPSIVERLLLERYGITSVCVNHGVAGWYSADQLHHLLHNVEYAPDTCVFYDGWNCCWNIYNGFLLNTCHGATYMPVWRQGTSLRHCELNQWTDANLRASALMKRTAKLLGSNVVSSAGTLFSSRTWKSFFHRLAAKYFPLRTYYPTDDLFEHEGSNHDPNGLVDATVSEYLRIDRLARGICQQRKIHFLHCVQPLIQTTNRPLTEKEQGMLDASRANSQPDIFAKFSQRAVSQSSTLTDLTNVFDKVEEDVFLDDGHLNRFGNYHIAARIVTELLNKGLISQNGTAGQ